MTFCSRNADVLLTFAPGEAYQFDWSHEIVAMDGVTTQLWSWTRSQNCALPRERSLDRRQECRKALLPERVSDAFKLPSYRVGYAIS
jgi:hypothetical protein